MEKTYVKRSITAELAARMVEAAAAKAKAIGVPQIVAILDESGLLKAFHRMDGAPLISIEVAQNKAYTALLGAPSQDFFNRIKDNPSLLAGVPHIPRIVTFGGGLPIRIDDVVVGGIGVSGGSVDQDIECAQAALDAIAKA
ncbi:MAG TPA: heme-binding protein [Candidatus Binataceae bacterium]|nr:heme-binding protein [Candidatus Binataceae bacterium]